VGIARRRHAEIVSHSPQLLASDPHNKVVKKRKQKRRLLRLPIFVLQYSEVHIHPSAFKHGQSVSDIQHGLNFSRHHFRIEDSYEPERILIIGPDTHGNFLELIGIVTNKDELLIIHSLFLRQQFHPLLER
jgi:hypothetical protein